MINRIKETSVVLLSLLLFANCNNSKDSKHQSTSESWKQSELFTNQRFTSVFPEGLKNVRNASTILQADSLMQNEILQIEASIPSDTLVLILNQYALTFPSEPRTIGFVQEEKAVLHLRKSQLDSSYFYSEKALKTYQEIKDTAGIGRSYMIIAGSFGFKGDFSNALKYQLKALEIFELSGNEAGKYDAMTEMANNFYLEGRYRESETLAKQVLTYAISSNNKFLHASILNTLGSIYHQLGNQQEFSAATLESIEIRKQLNDDYGLSEAYISLAVTFMNDEKWVEAIDVIKKASEIVNRIGDSRNFSSINYNLGICYLELGQKAEAEDVFLKIVSKAEETGVKDESLMRTLQKLASLYESQNDFGNAYKYSNKLIDIKSELFTEEKAKITSELTTKYQLEENRQSLVISENEKMRLQEKKLIMGFALIAVSLLSIALVLLLIQKNKNSKRLHQAEQKLKNEAVEKIQRELQYNREQLNDFTNHLVEKNKMIFELEKKLLKHSESSILRKKEDDEDSDEYASLLQLRILTDDDWSKFKMYFDKVFPGLILHLRQEHPNVTGAEERLFLLLKLKTDSREMSEMLGISMESVRKNKYRLKKKLQLEENQNLEYYISSF
jgi:tetratricopeptide (TPR) repeat protein